MFCIRILRCMLAVLCFVAGGPGVARAAPLDPLAFQPIGAFPATPGAYAIQSGANAPVLSGPDGISIVGTTSNGVSVFDFTSITLGAGQFLEIITHGPVALLSRTGITVAGPIIADGSGGVGGFGLNSLGFGPGGGGGGTLVHDSIGNIFLQSGGGGGGFGGAGGNGGSIIGGPQNVNVPGGAGGAPHANLVYALQTGSGGGGGSGAGGSGGGTVELGAVGSISISGSISANGIGASGESGGGGSGGGILLHGLSVNLTGSLSVAGGPGAIGSGGLIIGRQFAAAGGGGGGGEVVILTSTEGSFSGSLASIHVAGAGGGQPGVIQIGVVPEPAGLVQAATAVLMVGGYGWWRRGHLSPSILRASLTTSSR